MSKSFSTRVVRWGFNWFLAYRGTGARITYIARDWREVRIRLPLNWRTRDYGSSGFCVGSQERNFTSSAASEANICVMRLHFFLHRPSQAERMHAAFTVRPRLRANAAFPSPETARRGRLCPAITSAERECRVDCRAHWLFHPVSAVGITALSLCLRPAPMSALHECRLFRGCRGGGKSKAFLCFLTIPARPRSGPMKFGAGDRAHQEHQHASSVD